MPDNDHREGAPSHIHIERKKGFNWLPWLLLALGLLALLFALSRCGRDEEAAVAPAASPTATSISPPSRPARGGVRPPPAPPLPHALAARTAAPAAPPPTATPTRPALR